MIEAWIEARDGTSLEAAWTALGATTTDMGPEPTGGIGILGWYRTGYAAAQLASAWLGIPIEKLKWLASESLDGAPPPTFEAKRSVDFSFLEHTVNERDCYEGWDLRQVRNGNRGVQRVYVDWGRGDGSRDGGEGGRGTVVRYFDTDKQIGVCVPLYSSKVSLIGAVDIDVRGPLDLFDFNPSFRVPAWTTYDLDKVRGLLAQLATGIDAHVVIDENPPQSSADIRLEGLPWGHQLSGGMRFTRETAYGYFNARLPEGAATRMLERLKAIPVQLDG